MVFHLSSTSNLSFIPKFLKIFLIKTVTILMISAKLAFTGLLKRKIFQNKGYVITILDCDVTDKILPLHLNYLNCRWSWGHVVIWPKFGNSSISVREVIITSILWEFDQKNCFLLRGGLGSSSTIWDWHKVWPWNFTSVWQKGLKLKVKRF